MYPLKAASSPYLSLCCLLHSFGRDLPVHLPLFFWCVHSWHFLVVWSCMLSFLIVSLFFNDSVHSCAVLHTWRLKPVQSLGVWFCAFASADSSGLSLHVFGVWWGSLDFNLQEHSRPDLEFPAKRAGKAVGFNLSHDLSPHLWGFGIRSRLFQALWPPLPGVTRLALRIPALVSACRSLAPGCPGLRRPPPPAGLGQLLFAFCDTMIPKLVPCLGSSCFRGGSCSWGQDPEPI